MSMTVLLDRIKEIGVPIALDIGDAILRTAEDNNDIYNFETIKCIIDATASKAAAYYIDINRFCRDAKVHKFISDTLKYARKKGVFTILDFKSCTYSEDLKRCYECGDDNNFSPDAVTACPYLGEEYIQPFIFAANRYSKCLFVYLNASDDYGFSHFSDMLLYFAGQAFGASLYSNMGIFVECGDAETIWKIRTKMRDCMMMTKVSKINNDIRNYFNDDGSGALLLFKCMKQGKEFDLENLYVDTRRELEKNMRALHKTVFRKSRIIRV